MELDLHLRCDDFSLNLKLWTILPPEKAHFTYRRLSVKLNNLGTISQSQYDG